MTSFSPGSRRNDLVLRADPTPRQVLEALASHPAASALTPARELPISRQLVLKHLAVVQISALVGSLEAAVDSAENLVVHL
jgi:hypothetical protein